MMGVVASAARGGTGERLFPTGVLRQIFAGGSYRGPATDHFDGRRFHNLGEVRRGGLLPFWRWQFDRLRHGAGRWPRWIDAPPGPRPPERVAGAALRVTFVNHATTLIQTGGRNVLTDPTWAERASPVSWAGPRRHRPPGIRFEDLPAIDVVLLSHNHYDHLNIPTLRRLARDHRPRFVTGLGNGALLAASGVGPVTEMDWWQEAPLGAGVTLTCVPARHSSGRGLRDRGATLWCGFVLGGAAGPVYFAGDTGWGRHFEEIARRFGPPRLALLPIGAYLPLWFMAPVHLSPVEAVRAHEVLGARTSVAIHFGTFRIADDAEAQPVAELRAAQARSGEAARDFWVLGFGEGRDVP
jgi:L-ascorbate metabolism protein UlaG (beta-lactamase superfamily)